MDRRTVLSMVLFLLLLAPAAPNVGQQAAAQEEGWIEILEPSEWQGAGTRGLAAFPRTSIRVVGVARHPSGIREVQLNGRRASLQAQADGSVHFVGYVSADEALSEVEVLATSGAGRPIVKKYSVNMKTAGAAGDSPTAFAAVTGGERWAVIVGVSKYADDRINPLEYADADAMALYDFFTSEAAGLGGFKEENVLLLLNEEATYRDVRTALFTFLKGATEDDLVVIYFAGHGMPDPDRASNLYLLTYDTDLENVSGTAFPMEDVHTAVERTYARDILVLSDACHSAGIAGQAGFRASGLNQINEQFLDRLQASTGGLTVFTASQVNQLSQEGPQWGGGHGVFTYRLIEALKGAADEDQDRIVTVGEVTEWVRDRVRRETRNAQIPSLSQTAFDPYLPLAIVPAPEPDPEEEAQVEAPPTRVEEEAIQTPTPQMDVATPEVPEEETAAIAGFLSPSSAASRSLLLPGLGQFYTGQNGKGAGLMAVGIGALAAGFLVSSTTEKCAVTPASGSRCPTDQVVSSSTSRPLLAVGVAGWLISAAYSAFDAQKGAKEFNSRLLAAGPEKKMALQVMPLTLTSEGGRVGLNMLSLRF